jgi:hypothetical protein
MRVFGRMGQIAALILFLLSPAAFAVSPPVFMAEFKDVRPDDNGIYHFAPATPRIEGHWYSTYGQEGMKVRVTWIAVHVEGAPDNTLIAETSATMTKGDWWEGNFHVSVPDSGRWPIGTYRVDLYLDDQLAKQLSFTISPDISFAPKFHAAWAGGYSDGSLHHFPATSSRIGGMWDSDMGQEGSIVSFKWVAVQADGLTPNTIIGDTSVTLEKGHAWQGDFSLDHPHSGPWPRGAYRVDLYLDDQLVKQLSFAID